jgi:putative transcriptional regulator
VDSLRGQLLVASPALIDPNFFRTVVLVGEHGDEGAMGLVLNRPSAASVGEAVPDLEPLVDPLAPVFVGGPVRPSAVLVLAEWEEPELAGMLVGERIGFVPAEAEFEALEQATSRARVFAGYAGWEPGQLEGEVERSDWVVAPADEEDVFGEDPDELWPAVLQRLGGRFALLARMPADPSLN